MMGGLFILFVLLLRQMALCPRLCPSSSFDDHGESSVSTAGVQTPLDRLVPQPLTRQRGAAGVQWVA